MQKKHCAQLKNVIFFHYQSFFDETFSNKVLNLCYEQNNCE
jgi:hypothetical protein